MEPKLSRSLRIAIIESDDLIRQLLTRWLEPEGFLISHTVTDQVSKDEADLIIAGVHGAESATHLLSGLRDRSDAPVLLISARFSRGAAGSVQLAEKLGAKAVLPIPFTETELKRVVQKLLNAPG